MMSRTTRSKRPDRTASNPRAPSAQTSTAKPSASRPRRTPVATPSSSSTTRIRTPEVFHGDRRTVPEDPFRRSDAGVSAALPRDREGGEPRAGGEGGHGAVGRGGEAVHAAVGGQEPVGLAEPDERE